LQSPYNFSFRAPDTYEFITKNQISYRVSFIPDYTLNSLIDTNDFDNLYQIVIEKISDEIFRLVFFGCLIKKQTLALR